MLILIYFKLRSHFCKNIYYDDSFAIGISIWCHILDCLYKIHNIIMILWNNNTSTLNLYINILYHFYEVIPHSRKLGGKWPCHLDNLINHFQFKCAEVVLFDKPFSVQMCSGWLTWGIVWRKSLRQKFSWKLA